MMPLATKTGARQLDRLLAGWIDAAPPLPITGLSLDSRRIERGWLFLAIAGGAQHGAVFAAEAVRKGAVAVIAEPAGDWPAARLQGLRRQLGVPVLVLPGLARLAGPIASRFFADPSSDMPVIGVTGTNGKTSVSHFVAQALVEHCAIVGTLGNGFPGALAAATHTTPDPLALQALLADLRRHGAEAVAMEVSSHALHQHRVGGVQFDIAVFTNLSRDHLDYHGSMEAYAEAKARLFHGPSLHWAVVNADDEFGLRLLDDGRGRVRQVAYGCSAEVKAYGEWLQAVDVELNPSGLRCRVLSNRGAGELQSRLLGRFNVANLLATVGVLLAHGLGLEDSLRRAAALSGVPGRMQVFGGGSQPRVVVDYAHTPDALAAALSALREHGAESVTCVFGCGGERDRGKRPLMGRVAEQLADQVILTDDNPRSEPGEDIIDEIRSGMLAPQQVMVERSRAMAIRAAVRAAQSGQVVLVAGKGHEDYQLVGDLRLPFSDTEQVQRALSGEGV